MGSIELTKITADYKPRYICVKMETNKQGNPIGQIISRIPNLIYHILKILTK